MAELEFRSHSETLVMRKVCEEARLLELAEPHVPHVLAEVEKIRY